MNIEQQLDMVMDGVNPSLLDTQYISSFTFSFRGVKHKVIDQTSLKRLHEIIPNDAVNCRYFLNEQQMIDDIQSECNYYLLMMTAHL